MGRFKVLACLAVMLPLIGVMEGQSSSDRHVWLPFKVYRGYVLVVEGSIGGVPHRKLLIDTAAYPSVIDQDLARKLHLSSTSDELRVVGQNLKSEAAVVPLVQVGPVEARNLSVQVQDLHELGYDGGPFFSPDGKLIVYRAHHPKDAKEVSDYKELLAQSLIRPTYLEIWLMDADGEHKRQITNLGAASFAPSFFPDGKRIIFSSNVGSTGGMGNFELYAVDLDGKNVDRITFTDGFDGFPVFSPNGKKLVWVSGRNGKVPHGIRVCD